MQATLLPTASNSSCVGDEHTFSIRLSRDLLLRDRLVAAIELLLGVRDGAPIDDMLRVSSSGESG